MGKSTVGLGITIISSDGGGEGIAIAFCADGRPRWLSCSDTLARTREVGRDFPEDVRGALTRCGTSTYTMERRRCSVPVGKCVVDVVKWPGSSISPLSSWLSNAAVEGRAVRSRGAKTFPPVRVGDLPLGRIGELCGEGEREAE